jgi:hypothetical protein
VSTDSSRKKKWQGGKNKDKYIQIVTDRSWFSRGAVKTDEGKSESVQEHSSGGDKELPQRSDNENAKLASQILEEVCSHLIDMCNTFAFQTQMCLEEKVRLKTMTDPKNVNEGVNRLLFLIKITEDYLQHVERVLSVSHEYWAQEVEIHGTKTGEDVVHEEKHKKIITKVGRVDGKKSLYGVGGGDVEFHSLSENGSDNGKIENKETAEGQSDILCGDSDQIKEVRMDKSKKEWSDSNDSFHITVKNLIALTV